MYDILIIGGGPAGITAGIYAKRANKSVAILERFALGGQINLIGKIENYLGFSSIEGADLAREYAKHAKSLDIPVLYEEAKSYQLLGDVKKVFTRKNVYEARAIIFAQGCHPRALGIKGEEQFKGRGVSYCAVCDGNFFKGKCVAVVGSSDSAVSDAEYLANICEKVYLVSDKPLTLICHDENEFCKLENVETLIGVEPKEIVGDEKVSGLVYAQAGKEKTLSVDAVFVAVGRTPDTDNLKGQLALDDKGFIIVDEKLRANVDGVFAIGDVKSNSLKQIATAVGDGCIAGTEAVKYVSMKMSKKI